MECSYQYKGKFFANEIELDDFLIETKSLPSDILDIVMQTDWTKALNRLINLLYHAIGDFTKRSSILDLLSEDMKATFQYDDYGDLTSYEKGDYVPVTTFISQMRQVNSKGEEVLIAPEFILDNYFKEREKDWVLGKYQPDELIAIPVELGYKATKLDIEDFRERIEKKWNWQAYTGTAIHDVMDMCFKKEKGETVYNFQRFPTDIDAAAQYVYDKLRDKTKENVSLETVTNLVRAARNINEQLCADTGSSKLFFLSEVTIEQPLEEINQNTAHSRILRGRVDLIAIDEQGNVHIVDYKTSPKDYGSYYSAKTLAFKYLLALYNRMLQKKGLRTNKGNMYIYPITLKGIHRESTSDGRYPYAYDGVVCPLTLERLDYTTIADRLWANIDRYLPCATISSISIQDAGLIVSKFMLAVGLDITDKRTEEEIWADRLKKLGGFKMDENGRYSWKLWTNKIVSAASEAELLSKVMEEVNKYPKYKESLVNRVKEGITKSINEGASAGNFIGEPVIREENSREDYVYQMLRPYFNGGWEIVDNEFLESYGILVLKTVGTILPAQVDIIRVSIADLTLNRRQFLDKKDPIRNRKGLTGFFEPDIKQQSNSDSLMLEATNGNIELMETMALLNQTEGLESCVIGNIKVINPTYGKGMTASNRELAYCWKELVSHAGDVLPRDKFTSGELKLASDLEKYRLDLYTILTEATQNHFRGDYYWVREQTLQACISLMDECINDPYDISDRIEKIEKIRRDVATMYGDKTQKRSLNKPSTYELIDLNQAARLEADALFAIAELRGINFRLEIRDHNNWCDNWNIFVNGWEGLNVNNPGLQASETLNLISKMLLESFLNLRSSMLRRKALIDPKLAKFKKAKGMFYAKEFVANLASIYSNLYEHTEDGDFVFKRLDLVVGEEREFLEFVLDVINRDRFPRLSDEELREKRDSGDINYYRVPITIGSYDSRIEAEGLTNMFKSKLRFLDPRYAAKSVHDKVEYLLTATSDQDHKNVEMMFEMTNTFSAGEGEHRIETIQAIGINRLEHNLEALLYKHAFAYSQKQHIDETFPMIKAAYIHLSDLGFMLNTKFNNELQYMKNFMKSKIFHDSINDPRLAPMINVLYKGRYAASVMTLAFSPVLRLYQELMSLWVNISLAIRQPDKLTADGLTAFTLTNFKKVIPMVYRDAFHYSDIPSMWEGINMTYGLNDMDMGYYGELINNSRKGLFNFAKFALTNTTRPDFYHRCTIFGCKMEADGCLDAHSVDKNGNLIYDWTKDKRFDAFAAGNLSDPRYNAQRSLYYAMAKEFELEHALMPNGERFRLNMSKPMALPRAYTTKLAESIKSLSDDIYGYYSEEKKSLIHTIWYTAMWFLLRTYWSAKKNQYVQSGGVRLRGDYTLLVLNGLKMYYQVIDGKIRDDLEFVTEDTGAPVIKWTGQWQEGVIVTMSTLLKESFTLQSFSKAFNSMWNNEDENLRYAYRNNMKKFMYDICLWMLGANIVCGALEDELREMVKDNKRDHDAMEGMQVAAFNVLVRSLSTSFLDVNFMHSVADPLIDWTPFMFNWVGRQGKNIWGVAMGDKNFYEGLLNVSSAAVQVKPFFDSLEIY